MKINCGCKDNDKCKKDDKCNCSLAEKDLSVYKWYYSNVIYSEGNSKKFWENKVLDMRKTLVAKGYSLNEIREIEENEEVECLKRFSRT